MSSSVFQHKFQQTVQTDSAYLDLVSQFLAFLKLLIYSLVAIKFFQLIFLKYKKQLSVAERVEKKYKNSHHQLFETYSENEARLMQITIENTIKNAHIVLSQTQTTHTKRGSSKQVSFKEENNSYHNVESTRNSSEIQEEEYKDLQIESKFFKEIVQQDLHSRPKNEEIINVVVDNELKTIEETNSNIQVVEVNTDIYSKVSLQTQPNSQESTYVSTSQLAVTVDKTQ